MLAVNPKHPERLCWGCDRYCSADDLRCGNGTIRTQHPIELFGQDWLEWELNPNSESTGDLANSGDLQGLFRSALLSYDRPQLERQINQFLTSLGL